MNGWAGYRQLAEFHASPGQKNHGLWLRVERKAESGKRKAESGKRSGSEGCQEAQLREGDPISEGEDVTWRQKKAGRIEMQADRFEIPEELTQFRRCGGGATA